MWLESDAKRTGRPNRTSGARVCWFDGLQKLIAINITVNWIEINKLAMRWFVIILCNQFHLKSLCFLPTFCPAFVRKLIEFWEKQVSVFIDIYSDRLHAIKGRKTINIPNRMFRIQTRFWFGENILASVYNTLLVICPLCARVSMFMNFIAIRSFSKKFVYKKVSTSR